MERNNPLSLFHLRKNTNMSIKLVLNLSELLDHNLDLALRSKAVNKKIKSSITNNKL